KDAPVARDRDRLRQQVLEGHGWKLHRVWSPDWVRDRQGAINRVLERVDAVKAGREDEGDGPKTTAVNGSEYDYDDPDESWLNPAHFEAASEDPYADFVGTYAPLLDRQRPQEVLYQRPSWIRDDLVDIVDHEGPIHQELLARRVAAMYGLKQVGSRIR